MYLDFDYALSRSALLINLDYNLLNCNFQYVPSFQIKYVVGSGQSS
jgi:hypothetical protein